MWVIILFCCSYSESIVAKQVSTQALLDGLGHAALLFAADGKLLHSNIAAGTMLGTDLHLIRAEGWAAAVTLFDADIQKSENTLTEIRKRALSSDRPVRFNTLRNGEYVPCSASAVATDDGDVQTLLMLDVTDWGVVGSVLDRFNKEMHETVESTIGHISLIVRTLYGKDDDPAAAKIARRLGGFSKLIEMHMKRAQRLMKMTDRLEDLRTGKTRQAIQDKKEKIELAKFVEDFLQSLDEVELLDPETESHDFHGRIQVTIPAELAVMGVEKYLTTALHEVLRNAIMYSLRGTPVKIQAALKGSQVQIDIIDEGYGIREKDYELVFGLFQRGRNPQIMSEFGYGLALHLVKNEIALMNGKLWFTAVDNVTTTFSILLPAASVDSSSAKTA
jgi:two-component system sensor histidine kinase SenX3